MKIFRFVSGTTAALALVAGLTAAEPAAARDRLSPGAAVAIGALGGLAVGAAVGAAVAAPPVYAAPVPVYRAPPPPPPVYVEERAPVYYERPVRERVYVERCETERFREWIPGWGWEHRTRRICR